MQPTHHNHRARRRRSPALSPGVQKRLMAWIPQKSVPVRLTDEMTSPAAHVNVQSAPADPAEALSLTKQADVQLCTCRCREHAGQAHASVHACAAPC